MIACDRIACGDPLRQNRSADSRFRQFSSSAIVCIYDETKLRFLRDKTSFVTTQRCVCDKTKHHLQDFRHDFAPHIVPGLPGPPTTFCGPGRNDWFVGNFKHAADCRFMYGHYVKKMPYKAVTMYLK